MSNDYQTILYRRHLEGALIVRIQELFQITLGEALLAYLEKPFVRDRIAQCNLGEDEETHIDELISYF